MGRDVSLLANFMISSTERNSSSAALGEIFCCVSSLGAGGASFGMLELGGCCEEVVGWFCEDVFAAGGADCFASCADPQSEMLARRNAAVQSARAIFR